MLQLTMKIGLIVFAVACLAGDARAFDGSGLGAGCGGGIGASYSGSSYSGGSFGCTGYVGGYTGWTNGTGPSGGYRGYSYMDRGYSGWRPSSADRERPSPAARSAARPTKSDAESTSRKVLLTVMVPADAKLFVNDQPTNSTGQRRQFSSSRLQPGTVYRYRLRAEFVTDGKPMIEEKDVHLTPSQTVSVSFAADIGDPVAAVATTAQP